MAKMVLQELDMRIHQLREVEKQSYLNEEEKKCLECRRTELENMRRIIKERLSNNTIRKTSNTELWKLVDEF